MTRTTAGWCSTAIALDEWVRSDRFGSNAESHPVNDAPLLRIDEPQFGTYQGARTDLNES